MGEQTFFQLKNLWNLYQCERMLAENLVLIVLIAVGVAVLTVSRSV